MILPASRLKTLFRAALLGLVMLGVLIKPMFSSYCEMHALGHALATSGQTPGQSDDHQIDQDHASGAHVLLHASDNDSAYADIVTVFVLPAVRFDTALIPQPDVSAVPSQPVVSPFRPPIA